MMFRIPVITGLGLVTPLGASVEETWSALLKGRAIETHAKAALAEEGSRARVDQLAIAAATEAFERARWMAHSTDSRTALIVGTSKGAVTSWITPPPHITSLPYIAGGLNVCGVASTAMEVGRALGLSDGPRLTMSAACASGLNALIRAAMMIRSGEVDRALVVAAEASVHPLFSGSFKRLGVLPAEGELCRPLDRARSGFFISEAAAAVCLEARTVDPESECDALTARRPFAIVDRFALGGDATHITGSDPSGQPLRRILRDVAGFRQSSATPLRPIIHVMLSSGSPAETQQIDLIHAHATGTEFNDSIELAAYGDECTAGENAPLIYSHKGALGHSLGASGLVSVVLNCLSHRTGTVPGNVRTTQPLASNQVRISTEVQRQVIRRSIAVAAGFGGAIAAVSLRSP